MVTATVTESGTHSSSEPAFISMDPARVVDASVAIEIEPALASTEKSSTDAPGSPIVISPALASMWRLVRLAPSRARSLEAAFASTPRSSATSVGRTTCHAWRDSPKPKDPPHSAATRSEDSLDSPSGSEPRAYRASTVQSVPPTVETPRSPQLKSSSTSAVAANAPSSAKTSSGSPPHPMLMPSGHPLTSVPAMPPTMRPAASVATMANGVRAAMTASTTTMRTTGQKRQSSRAVSPSMAPDGIASATAPAVMRVTPQKTSPRLICTQGTPARAGTIAQGIFAPQRWNDPRQMT